MTFLYIKVFFYLALFSSIQFFTACSTEFEVGGKEGWAVPKSKNDEQMYNQWASKNRFKVDDSVRFEYKEDSVMVVSEEEYDNCLSSHPQFFSNNGDTTFKVDRPGLFYFISGVSGHCQRGQKMIIKVLEPESPPPPTENQNSTREYSPKESGGAVERAQSSFATILKLVSVSLFIYLFH